MPLLPTSELEIEYDSAGDGTPVVLVHGNYASSRWWKPLFDRRPAGIRLIAPSTRGCGQSQRTATGYDLPTLASDLRRLLTALEVRRIHLVGHSLGGAIAMQYAVDWPDDVATLMLVAPAPTTGLEPMRQSDSRLGRMLRLAPTHAPASLATLDAMVRIGRVTGANRRLLRESIDAMLACRIDPAQFDALVEDALAIEPEANLGFLQALDRWNVRERLATLTVPTLVLWGDKDPIVPRSSVEQTAADIPSSRLVVWEDAGHSPMYSRPDQFAELLFEHVARTSIGMRVRRLLQRTTTPVPSSKSPAAPLPPVDPVGRD
jgi:pimeloyl-ACP methyl ester carboxylesterase